MKKWKDKIEHISAIIFFSITIITILLSMFIFREFSKAPEITRESLLDSLTTRIYDKDNNVIATIGNERREFVDNEDIPQVVKDAVLSVEDTRFYNHIGVDPKRIIKALLVNIASGESKEGGSTITQQVIKTSLLTSIKSYERKLQEVFLSLKLESKYTKDDILEMYLNKIFYSDNQYGIRTAAKYFYNKELNELTVPQVALLAGIPQQPVVYNPYDNPEKALERRNTVLYAMYNNGKISKDEYNEYSATPIDDGLVVKTATDRQFQNIVNIKYGAYVDLVVKEIKSLPIFSEDQDPLSLGLNVYTNLDTKLQEYVQTMLDEESWPMQKHPSQAAITVLNTKTGLVEAIGGGKNFVYGGFNYSTDSRVQPGSAIKPILDYAPGIEYYGWDSLTIFEDTEYLIKGTNYKIENWDRQYHGNVTMRTALALSYNIPAVRAFEKVGYERSKYFANKLGIEVSNEMPTTAIGGNVDTVSPIQMAGAFASFGNKGVYNKPSGIIKIVDKYGNELPINREVNKRVMNESTAFIITDMLKDVLTTNGISPNGKVAGFDMAGKSGSSTFDDSAAINYGIDVVNSTKDSWMVGYTTEHTVSVWQGVDNLDSAEKALNYIQAQTTQQIFANVMLSAHNGKVPEKFSIPNTVKLAGVAYYATDRNTETDNMYVGTALDAIYQARVSEKNRENRKNATILENLATLQKNNNTNNNNSTTTNTNNTTNRTT